MRPVLTFFLFSALLFCGCVDTKGSKDPLEKKISRSSAEKDFRIFKKILEAAHPSLTLYKSKEKIDLLFDSVYNSLSSALFLRDLYNNLYYITNEVGCSHTDVYLPAYMYDTLLNRKFFFPYPVLLVENKLLVNVTGYDITEGTEINSINGMPVTRILEHLAIYNSIEGFHRSGQKNMASKDFSFQYFLKWGEQKKFELEITDTLGKKQIVFKDPITLEEWNTRNDSKYYFDGQEVDYDLFINNERGYALLRLPSFDFFGYQKQTGFEHFCTNAFELLEKKKNITRLIIDLRENTGGRLYAAFLLFSYLAKKPFSEYDYVVSKINRIPYPDYLSSDFISEQKGEINKDLNDEFSTKRKGNYYFADSLIGKWTPNPHRFTGRVYVITNPATASSASYFAVMVKNTGVGKIVGDETAGGSSSGNGFSSLEYVLPNSGLRFLFPYAHIIYSLKEKNTGGGLKPNFNVPDTYKSFMDNKDIQVNFILDSLNLN